MRERGSEDAREYVTRTGGGRVGVPCVHAINFLAWGRDRGDPALVQDEAVERVGKLPQAHPEPLRKIKFAAESCRVEPLKFPGMRGQDGAGMIAHEFA